MAAFTKTEFIWMNGDLTPWDSAQVHVSAHALQYGTGVFEGMRAYPTPDGPAIFRLDAHMHRFKASARAYELDIPVYGRAVVQRVARGRANERARGGVSPPISILRFAQLRGLAERMPGLGGDHRGPRPHVLRERRRSRACA